MYTLAAISWAILVSALLQVVEHHREYAFQDAGALIMKDKTLQWCLGLNVGDYLHDACGSFTSYW